MTIDVEDLVKQCTSWSELYRRLNLTGQPNGRTLTKFIKDFSHLDTKHFDKNASKRKYTKVTKPCPVCSTEFNTVSGGSKETFTCSYSCSNTYFRSSENNGNWNPNTYRTTCFLFHKKECVVCGEDKIVQVHHFDEDHHNNSPENLIPLCPTHHQYWHSRYKYLVESIVLRYRENFLSN